MEYSTPIKTYRKEQMVNKENAPLIIVNNNGNIESLNKAAEELLGYRLIDIKNRDVSSIFTNINSNDLLNSSEKILETMLNVKNAQRSVKVHSEIVELFGQSLIFLSIEEQIEQQHYFQKIEIELQESLSELIDLKFALDESSIVAITNQKGIITYVNETFCTISKYTNEELIGNSHKIINSGYHSKEFFRDLWNTISSGKVWKGEIRNKAKDHTYYWVDTTIVPFLDKTGNPYQYLAIRNEVTARKHAEEELQRMMSKLIGIQEEERKNISRELHDGIGQNLYSLLIMINRLRTNSNPEIIEQLEMEISTIIEEIRQISWQLRPSILDDLGLVPAIRSFVNKFSEHYGFKTDFTYKLQKRLPSEVETSIYRIIQEAMTNIRKYAETKEIFLSLSEEEDYLLVQIKDDGIGFDPNIKRNGVGLFSMEERARSIKAKIDINSKINEGTIITVKVPFNK
ncbi:PAS domain S-box-containing protein [Metabacillus crassostreae]|uniref:PAS domain-containing sensor histidine kinase n=1 Tax=Metabacillus crassostreae TaxID=929098 RepID=UPI001EF79FCC|nr:PAS domain-containing protein [Metabacillus crassostreae]MBM7605496.1 PAS domain S-box-containing protein [Metabacillus crassostreae]